MKNTIKLISILTLLLTISFSYGQTGTVAGTVIDGDFNEPLAFANILVKGTTKGTTSDFDGKYQLDLEPGTHTLVFSFVGYDTQEITDVVIKSNEVTTLDVTLTTNALETVVVTTSVKRNTENAVLNIQKKSATLLDGLSAQSIKKTGAGNLAAAVKTVPGVSVEGGKYVYVRGLGDRYTKSILNGVDIPGLDPDRNTIQMDIFPTNILDNIIVVKSAAAEYPADFTGGVVNIITKDFPTKAEYSVSTGLGYNPSMHFNSDYLNHEGSSSDFLGYDNGKRDLPIHRYQPIPSTSQNQVLLTSLTNQFDKQLRADRDTSLPNFNFGFTAGNQYEIGDDRLGYQASLSYKNSTTHFDNALDGIWRRLPRNTTTNVLPNELEDDLRTKSGEISSNNVILNGLLGLAYKTDNSKYKVNFLHIQNGEKRSYLLFQDIAQDGQGGGDEPLTKDGLEYTERSITNLLLSGEHKLGSQENAWNFDWKLSPTFAKVLDKDHRVTPLQQSQNGNYFISPSASSFPLRLWRTLQEESWNLKADFDKKYTLFGRSAKIKVGGGYVYKFRDFSTDQFTFQIFGDASFMQSGNPNNFLLESNIWNPTTNSGTHISFGDTFIPINAYEGEQNIASAYISNEFNVSEKLKAIVGLRTELFTSYYTGENSSRKFVREKTADDYDFFPSANLIYALTEKSNLRASYSRTTARASFKEASTAQIYDPITNSLFIGGLDNGEYAPIRSSYINNFDLRYEVFREKGQMMAFSAFFKSLKDPIEKAFFKRAAGQITVANLGDSQVYGVEMELRQNLGFIMADLENLRFNLNASYIKSELEMTDTEFQLRDAFKRDGETIDRKRDLQGQSPYLINAGLDYNDSDKGFRAGLFYNVQGKTLEVVGTGVFPDVYTKPFHSLNLTANYAFGEKKNSAIDFKISNILGSERKSVYESFQAQDQLFKLRDPGTEFSIGYSYKF